MAERPDDAHEGRWPLRGFWQVWYWISWVVAALVLVSGLGLAALAWWSPAQAAVVLLCVSVVLLAVGTVIGWQLAHTAVVVTLGADGMLSLRRVHGTLHTPAAGVRRVRASVLVSYPHTPTVLETADGAVVLIHTRDDVDEMIAAIRRENPGLRVDLRQR